jgi:hypothetical protein
VPTSGCVWPKHAVVPRARAELQKRILARMRAFGMSPVLPAFAGFVPAAFVRRFPEASYARATRWGGFPDQFCCPHMLDPLDPLFQARPRRCCCPPGLLLLLPCFSAFACCCSKQQQGLAWSLLPRACAASRSCKGTCVAVYSSWVFRSAC